MRRARALLESLMLRRVKSDVESSLPPKLEFTLKVHRPGTRGTRTTQTKPHTKIHTKTHQITPRSYFVCVPIGSPPVCVCA